MKALDSVSYGIRNLSDYRVLFIGDHTVPNPRTAYYRNDGAVTIRASNPSDTLTFESLGTVFGVRHGDIAPQTAHELI